MKKRRLHIAALSLMLASSIMMSACSPRQDTDSEEETSEAETSNTTEATTEETTTVSPESRSIDDSDLPALYAGALDEILYHLSGNLAEDDIFSYTGIDEIAMTATYENDVSERMGYIFRDLNNDRIKELIILDKSEYNDGYGYRILAIFTLDRKPKLITEGWARNQLYLMEDNILYNFGSSGAAYQTVTAYTYDKDYEPDVISKFYTDFEDENDPTSDIKWFEEKDGKVIDHGTTASYEPDLNLPDFDQIKDFTPFSSLPHRYEAVVTDCTYEQAKTLCEEMGGHLVTIASPQEAAIVTTVVSMNSESENEYMSGFIGYICEIDYKGSVQ